MFQHDCLDTCCLSVLYECVLYFPLFSAFFTRNYALKIRSLSLKVVCFILMQRTALCAKIPFHGQLDCTYAPRREEQRSHQRPNGKDAPPPNPTPPPPPTPPPALPCPLECRRPGFNPGRVKQLTMTVLWYPARSLALWFVCLLLA